MQQDRNNSQPEKDAMPAVNIGNASNPSADDQGDEALSGNQILTAGAEKYLREVASIEDVPDDKDYVEMVKVIDENKAEKNPDS